MDAALSLSPGLLQGAPVAPSAGSGPLTDARRAKIAHAAKEFETQFVSVMLGQMFEGTDAEAPFGGGEGEGMFRSFMTDAMAKSMTARGGIGLSAAIQTEMLKMQGAGA